MNENAVALAVIGLATGICSGFFALVNKQIKIHGQIAHGLDRLAKAHETGNKESAERNGHLGELVTEQTKFTKESTSQILKAVQSIPTQHVSEQKVDHQTVKSKE
jgi:hypothetical protein